MMIMIKSPQPIKFIPEKGIEGTSQRRGGRSEVVLLGINPTALNECRARTYKVLKCS